ncbi:hypothetical protein IAR55_004818 [Kwoniella newhampshirensis]|uniref:Nicotinamide-nucleotide adenylyltransferase n=1 Tax=Kwoniella newhampshirensis TaxID=1651941 RepID=A0AAW0YMZ8_9TREE
MPSGSSDLSSLVQHISSTARSFALVHSTPGWPYPPPGADPPSSSSSRSNARSDTTPSGSTCPPLHIAILDSSFNPPTLAHQSIASSSNPPLYKYNFPSATPTGVPRDITTNDVNNDNLYNEGTLRPTPTPTPTPTSTHPYTSRLLLFSARNVEKTLKEGDTTPVQRLEMMSLLSETLRDLHPDEGVAVGLINEATFVGKAGIIRDWLVHQHQRQNQRNQSRSETQSQIDLTFLIGTDTLVRVFDPRFYPPGEMESLLERLFTPSDRGGYGATLVSARRGTEPSDRALEEEILNRDGVKKWVVSGHVRILGAGSDGWEDVSSTKVREAVKSDGQEGDDGGLIKMVGKDIGDYIKREGLYK